MLNLRLTERAVCPALDLSHEDFEAMDLLQTLAYLERHSMEVLASVGGWPSLVKSASWIGPQSPDFPTLETLTSRYVDGVISIAPDLAAAAKMLGVDPSTLYRRRRKIPKILVNG